MNSMQGHMMLLYAGILEVHDIAEKFQQNSNWSIPDALSVTFGCPKYIFNIER